MRKAIVVGASSGIGEAVARELSARGWTVGVAARRLDQLETLVAEMASPAHAMQIDVSDPDSARGKLHELIATLDGLDLLVISAAMANPKGEVSWEKEKAQIDVNVTGFTAMAFEAYEYFKTQGNGHLAAISSVAGLRGNRFNPMYSASKAFMFRYLESLRLISIKENLDIRVTDIRPGFVDTDMDGTKHIKEAAALRAIVMSPKKAAREIVDGLYKGKRTIYVPKLWKNVELPYKIIPDFLYEKL